MGMAHSSLSEPDNIREPNLWNLISALTSLEPRKRPSASETERLSFLAVCRARENHGQDVDWPPMASTGSAELKPTALPSLLALPLEWKDAERVSGIPSGGSIATQGSASSLTVADVNRTVDSCDLSREDSYEVEEC